MICQTDFPPAAGSDRSSVSCGMEERSWGRPWTWKAQRKPRAGKYNKTKSDNHYFDDWQQCRPPHNVSFLCTCSLYNVQCLYKLQLYKARVLLLLIDYHKNCVIGFGFRQKLFLWICALTFSLVSIF